MAYTLRQLAFNTFMVGDYRHAQQHCQEGLVHSTAIDERLGMATTLGFSIWIAVMTDGITITEAQARAAKSLTLVQESGHRFWTAIVLYILVEGLHALADVEQTEHYCNEGIDVARAANVVVALASCLAIKGDLACQRGELRLGRACLREAMQVAVTAQVLPFALEALVYYAGSLLIESRLSAPLASEAQQIRAVELLTLAAHHPACWHFLKERVARLQTELAALLPPAATVAQPPVQQGTLEATIAEILHEERS